MCCWQEPIGCQRQDQDHDNDPRLGLGAAGWHNHHRRSLRRPSPHDSLIVANTHTLQHTALTHTRTRRTHTTLCIPSYAMFIVINLHVSHHHPSMHRNAKRKKNQPKNINNATALYTTDPFLDNPNPHYQPTTKKKKKSNKKSHPKAPPKNKVQES